MENDVADHIGADVILPKSAMNVTLDGINIQDNSNKSSDGFFSYIYTPIDAVGTMRCPWTISSAEIAALIRSATCSLNVCTPSSN